MKLLFLSILFSNIVFFFWEYRKGAPEIYLPTNIESKASHDKQHIFLLSELPAKVVPLVIDSANNNEVSAPKVTFIKPLLLDENSVHSPQKEIAAILIANPEVKIIEPDERFEDAPELAELNVKTEVLFACYPLREGEYSEQMFITSNKSTDFKFVLVQQEQQYISSYLVLTLAANSYQEAKAWEKEFKEQGINELWLFTRGNFKWRISLGLFSTKNRAEKMKVSFSKRMVRELEVVPSHQTRMLTEIKIGGQETDISLFKDEFSQYFKQESECAEVQN